MELSDRELLENIFVSQCLILRREMDKEAEEKGSSKNLANPFLQVINEIKKYKLFILSSIQG